MQAHLSAFADSGCDLSFLNPLYKIRYFCFSFSDIYREAFENTTRTEEAKFKIRFDNLLSDMTKSIEKQSPRDGSVPAGFGSTSCKLLTVCIGESFQN